MVLLFVVSLYLYSGTFCLAAKTIDWVREGNSIDVGDSKLWCIWEVNEDEIKITPGSVLLDDKSICLEDYGSSQEVWTQCEEILNGLCQDYVKKNAKKLENIASEIRSMKLEDFVEIRINENGEIEASENIVRRVKDDLETCYYGKTNVELVKDGILSTSSYLTEDGYISGSFGEYEEGGKTIRAKTVGEWKIASKNDPVVVRNTSWYKNMSHMGYNDWNILTSKQDMLSSKAWLASSCVDVQKKASFNVFTIDYYGISGVGTYTSNSYSLLPIVTIKLGEKQPLQMVWRVPENQEITLPIEANAKNEFIVFWGDETIDKYDGTVSFPTHTYANSGIYYITICGSLYSFGYLGKEVPTSSNSYSNYYTFTQYMTSLTKWGELGVEGNYVSLGNANNRPSYGFSNCINLEGTIPEPIESFENAVTAEGLFQNCNKIEDIPETLFAGASKIRSFESTFAGSGFNRGIPRELFADCVQVENFFRTFYDCVNLTGGEIDCSTTNVTTLESMFQECSNLESLVFYENFKQLNGRNMFASADKLTAIMLLALPTSESDVNNNYTIATVAQIPRGAKIYVANKEVEKYFEGAWTNILGTTTADIIHTIVEPIGDNPAYVAIKDNYIDAGCTVAGYTTEEEKKYIQYGFSVSTDGIPVDTETAGEKYVNYSLNQYQPIHFTLFEVQGENITEIGNYETKMGTSWDRFCKENKELNFVVYDGSNTVQYKGYHTQDMYTEKEMVNHINKYDIILDNGCYYTKFEAHAECVKGNTNILTSIDGNILLAKDIQEGDSIVYYDFAKNQLAEGTVSKVYIHKDATNFVTYTFADGSQIDVTDYHPIYTKTGWKSYTHRNGYEAPEIGDNVKTPEGWKTLTKIEASTGLEDCYDFAIVDKNGKAVDNYFGNGTLVQNSILQEK